MENDESFVALVHHDGRIRYKSKEGVKFTNKSPANVFMTTRTTLVNLQDSIIRKLGLDGGKRVKIFYRIPISVVAQGVKYGCLAVEGDDDLQILFHCRRQFPEVRTTELFVEGVPLPFHGPPMLGEHLVLGINEMSLVASPSFDFNLQAEVGTGADELRDTRSFGELGVAAEATPHAVSPPPAFAGVPDPDPQVVDALRVDDSDAEPEFIEGESDDEAGPVPPPQGGASSSGTQQYPTHLSDLNLDALSGPGRGASGSTSDAQASQGSNMPAEFAVGQSFHTKEEAVLAVKNYNIRRGVEYRVMDSDHVKYLGVPRFTLSCCKKQRIRGKLWGFI
ncbi:hypothetical protein PIB30_021862 [Stylosanthes scabra]|uniref:Transposase MuDR plant domain-containing protein n=1 Tax=Stylosanthes scabra TaxID=79078 RepID=A0ABU6QAG6_9FABA|nr:hypothetical protein [Stylosanthes scabra]